MKKHIIAAAVAAAVAVPAMAQNVELYGTLDAGYGSTETKFSGIDSDNPNRADIKNAKDTGINSVRKSSSTGNVGGPLTSNRLGLRGSEDLGGGMKAMFNIEWDMDGNGGLSNTVNSTQARTGIVGISSASAGSLTIGRQLTGLHTSVAGFSPIAGNNMVGDILYSGAFRAHSGSNLRPNLTTVSEAGSSSSAIDAVRMNNSVAYVSPNMGGFDIRVDYAGDNRNTGAGTAAALTDALRTTANHLGVSVRYNAGPLRVSASNHSASADLSTTDATKTKAVYNAVSAAYAITKDFDVQVSYADAKHTFDGDLANKTTGYRIGASYTMGAVVLVGQWGQGTAKTELSATNGALSAKDPLKADRDAYQLAAIYNLSKRTNLYAAYGSQQQKITDQEGAGTTVEGDKRRDTQYAIGVRHAF